MLCTAHAGGGSHSCGLGALSRSAEAGSECCGRETASPRHSPPPTLTRTRLPWAPSRPRALGGTLQRRRIACTVLAGDECTGLLAAAGCGEKRRRPDVCDRRLARRATLGLWARGRACGSKAGARGAWAAAGGARLSQHRRRGRVRALRSRRRAAARSFDEVRAAKGGAAKGAPRGRHCVLLLYLPLLLTLLTTLTFPDS